MHVISENVIVEVVDESGQAVIGKEGDILISDLNNRVMPFIRYRIGDRGRILASQCSCGRIGPDCRGNLQTYG
jgi:phenylacetate-CoA ligase